MLALGSGFPLPKWFEASSISGPSGTAMTASIMVDGVVMPLAGRTMPQSSVSFADILGLFPSVQLPKIALAALGLVRLPPHITVMGRPIKCDDPTIERGNLSVTVVADGKSHTWEKDVDFSRVKLAEVSDMLGWIKLVQSGQVPV